MNEHAATEVFEKDCIIYLGTCVAPVGAMSEGQHVMDINFDAPSSDGTRAPKSISIEAGAMRLIPLEDGHEVEARIIPKLKHIDVGAGLARPGLAQYGVAWLA